MFYLIATPIGNLEDLGRRALTVLQRVPVIVCERPRQTLKLLSYYQLFGKRLISYTERNKLRQIPVILKLLETTEVAFVSDAGTVAVSDPGPELIEAVRKQGIKIVSIPGPSAITAAIALAGERIKQFLFVGFLPRKQSELNKLIQLSLEKDFWLAGYEAPHRLEKSLTFLKQHYPQLRLVLVGEISKINEKVIKGTPEEILKRMADEPNISRGEWVVFLTGEASFNSDIVGSH